MSKPTQKMNCNLNKHYSENIKQNKLQGNILEYL